MSKTILFATLALTTVSLSGCVSEAATGPEELDPALGIDDAGDCTGDNFCSQAAVIDLDTGRDLRTDMIATDILQAPRWQVGDVFEQHIYYGNADTTGEHIKTIVVDDTGPCYDIATTSETAAKFDATFNLPILGCIGKDKLETGMVYNEWDWMYDFPLNDGKTWNGQMNAMLNWNDYSLHDYAFILTATYDPAIDTWTGDFPGFIIEGKTERGEILLRYNYVPAVGWFSHFWIYDLTTDDPTDVVFHAMSMGTSTGFTGWYLRPDAETIMQDFVVPPFAGNEKVARQFDITDSVTTIFGAIVPIACPGTAKVVINTPNNNQQQYDHTFNDDPNDCVEGLTESGYVAPTWYSVHEIDQPAETGTYTMSVAGAGLYGYYAWLTTLTEKQYELTEADLKIVENAAQENDA